MPRASLFLCFSRTETSQAAKNSLHCLGYQKNTGVTLDKHLLLLGTWHSYLFIYSTSRQGVGSFPIYHLSSKHKRASPGSYKKTKGRFDSFNNLVRSPFKNQAFFESTWNSPWQGFYPCWTLPLAFQTQWKELRPSGKCLPVAALFLESVWNLPQGCPASGLIGLFYYTTASGKTKGDSLYQPQSPCLWEVGGPVKSHNTWRPRILFACICPGCAFKLYSSLNNMLLIHDTLTNSKINR